MLRFGGQAEQSKAAKEPQNDDNKTEAPDDRMQKYYEVDQIIPKIDQQIQKLKEQFKKGKDSKKSKGSKEAALELAQSLKTLQNQRNDRLIKLQKMYRIKVQGEHVPMMLDSFEKMKEQLALSDAFMRSVKKAGYERPTPVQMQAVPILFEKRDAIFLAETGSGKSLAFIVPLLHMHAHGDGIKAIVVAPTRELSIQLYKEFLMFSKVSDFAGGKAKAQNDGANQAAGSARVRILRKALTPKTPE